jgi:hypothetical protein
MRNSLTAAQPCRRRDGHAARLAVDEGAAGTVSLFSVPAGTRTATSRVARGGWKADKAHRSAAEEDADMIPYVCFQHGMYMSVRGWLRVGHKRRDAVASR